jgi:putative transcriptional regulator
MGLVMNRPAGTSPAEAVPDLKGLAQYRGELYYGGPVRLHTMRTLLRTDSPPEDALFVIENVYLTDVDEALLKIATTDAVIRFYAGYAGWAPGQLEYEIQRGSWHVITATENQVFSDEPEAMWERLQPPQTYRAFLELH